MSHLYTKHSVEMSLLLPLHTRAFLGATNSGASSDSVVYDMGPRRACFSSEIGLDVKCPLFVDLHTTALMCHPGRLQKQALQEPLYPPLNGISPVMVSVVKLGTQLGIAFPGCCTLLSSQ